jgi:hypothetical protein
LCEQEIMYKVESSKSKFLLIMVTKFNCKLCSSESEEINSTSYLTNDDHIVKTVLLLLGNADITYLMCKENFHRKCAA